jgi:hypothetical protein
MKNSNIIISVIIVLCIAGAVTAYSITNPEGGISNLLGYTPTDNGDNGDGSSGIDGINNGSSSNSNGGSSGNSGSSGNNNTNPIHNGMNASQAKSIAQNAIAEEGAYAGNAYWDSSIEMWVVKVYNKHGKVVDGIGIDANGRTNRV